MHFGKIMLSITIVLAINDVACLNNPFGQWGSCLYIQKRCKLVDSWVEPQCTTIQLHFIQDGAISKSKSNTQLITCLFKRISKIHFQWILGNFKCRIFSMPLNSIIFKFFDHSSYGTFCLKSHSCILNFIDFLFHSYQISYLDTHSVHPDSNVERMYLNISIHSYQSDKLMIDETDDR